MSKSVIIWLVTIWMTVTVSAQQKIITGVVKDSHTDERIPFAGVRFKGTDIGVAADENGNFRFVFDQLPSDSLTVSVLGYSDMTLPVNQTADSQFIDFEMDRTGYAMQEFVVHGGVNPALILLRKIIHNKPINNNDRLDSYKDQVYNKLEVDINKVDKNKFLHSKLFKPFQFVFSNIDTTQQGDLYLPILLTESLSDYYYQKNPHRTKEIILASKTSGIKNQSVTRYLGTMYQNVNIYDNFIPVFDKEFVSPIANFATLYYDYALVDTQYIDGRRCFHITFVPKRKTENVFTGDFWVNDTTFAIQKMTLEVTKNANLNFVSRISLVEEYQPLNDTLWFLSKDKFIADFYTPVANKLDFIGRKTTTYRDVIVDDTAATNIFKNKSKSLRYNIIVEPGARDRSDEYWETHRQEPLNRDEKGVYAMIDSLHHSAAYKKYSNTVQFLVTGVKEVGPLEFGPYYYELSANHLEDIRLRLDVGTNTSFSKNLYLSSYLAYGTADGKFKGNISAFWLLHRRPRMYLFGSYTHDLDNGSIYYGQINTDNIFTLAVYKPGVSQKFVMVDEKRLEFYKEGYTGFSQHITLVNQNFSPYAPLPTSNYFKSNGPNLKPLDNLELGVDLRFAYQEKFLEGNYYRVSLGSDYPIVELKYSAGLKGILRSNYTYHKLDFSISDNLSIAPFGSLYYNFFAGKIYGTLPFTLLQVPPGNNLFYYDKYAFDMMTRYEFLCDEYAGFDIENDIGGGIFNYIPLLKKLKLRQFWTAKGIIGNLSPANEALNFQGDAPFKSLQGNPYLELGTGVENIFHFFRVDFVWRVTPKLLPTEVYHQNFGVFGSVQLDF
jgi:Family of unknown function (DUF5686)/CarboxypepD_reg-like domain